MDSDFLDIQRCRRTKPYGSFEYIGRILWRLLLPFFKYSPRPFFSWRCAMLRLFGAQIGRNVHIYPSAYVYLPWMLSISDEASIGEWVLIYNLGHVSIGARATISQRVHLCAGTHDYRDPSLPLLRLPIEIGSEVWVCADAFIGPKVRVGDGAIVGAAAVVMSDVPPWHIVAGNPARFIKIRQMITKNKHRE